MLCDTCDRGHVLQGPVLVSAFVPPRLRSHSLCVGVRNRCGMALTGLRCAVRARTALLALTAFLLLAMLLAGPGGVHLLATSCPTRTTAAIARWAAVRQRSMMRTSSWRRASFEIPADYPWHMVDLTTTRAETFWLRRVQLEYQHALDSASTALKRIQSSLATSSAKQVSRKPSRRGRKPPTRTCGSSWMTRARSPSRCFPPCSPTVHRNIFVATVVPSRTSMSPTQFAARDACTCGTVLVGWRRHNCTRCTVF
jgi:hypothetical protein